MAEIRFGYWGYVLFTLLVSAGPWALTALGVFKYAGAEALRMCAAAYGAFVVLVALFFAPWRGAFGAAAAA